jgi:hypothetical protein
MAQREDLGGVMVPGVTGVDPAMAQAGLSPTLLRGQSGMETTGAVGSVAGSSAGMFVAAAMLDKDHFAAEPQHVRPGDLGTPSQAALDMARRLNEGSSADEAATESSAGGAWPEDTAWPSDGEESTGAGAARWPGSPEPRR